MLQSNRIATITLNPAIDKSVSIPNFSAGEVNRVIWEQSDPGGKGVNVASFLADLGFSTSVTGFIGIDNASIFEKLFNQKNMADHFVRLPGRTRVNVKIIDEVKKTITDINYPGQSPKEQDLIDLKKKIHNLVFDHDWFVLSGSLPNGIPTEFYAAVLKYLKNAGKQVVLDTSGDALRDAIVEVPYAIKPNIAELEELLGEKLTTERDICNAAKTLVNTGIEYVVVSMGKEGAMFVSGTESVVAVPPPIDVKSTVGAGDAMVAGFIAAKIKGFSLEDCAKLSTATAMGALTQLGPKLAETKVLESYMQQINVRKIVG
jgi:1-phosphofructokinase